MNLLESGIISDHFLYGYRGKSIDINTGIQHMIICCNQLPIICVCIVVNMPIDHIATLADIWPSHHRIVAERNGLPIIGNKQHWCYTFKPLIQIGFLHPMLIVVPNDQVLFPF